MAFKATDEPVLVSITLAIPLPRSKCRLTNVYEREEHNDYRYKIDRPAWNVMVTINMGEEAGEWKAFVSGERPRQTRSAKLSVILLTQ